MESLETSYYNLLEVSPYASISEIKRAFRKKAKALHPDTSFSQNANMSKNENQSMIKLVQAYKFLISLHKGFEGEIPFETFQNRAKIKKFDYRSWLLSQTDYENRTKLILFDLFHDFEESAIKEYLRIKDLQDGYNLFKFLEWHDFMDCGFVLAEELFFRQYFYQSFELLIKVINMEYEKPYFKHFFPEVLKLARAILMNKTLHTFDPDTIIEFYTNALSWDFKKNDKAVFSKRIANAYYTMGDTMMASLYIQKMNEFVPKMKKPNWIKAKAI